VFPINLNDVENVNLYAPLCKSHHTAVVFDFVMEGTIVEWCDHDVYKYSFFKGNYDKIRKRISEMNWQEKFSGKSADEMNEILVSFLLELTETFVPKNKCDMKKPKPK